jgi:hypothetical protein
MIYKKKTKVADTLKLGFYLIIGGLLFPTVAYFILDSVLELIEKEKSIGTINVVVISGIVGNLSAFILLIPSLAIVFFLISLITISWFESGRNFIKWGATPKKGLRVLWVSMVVATLYGFGVDMTIRAKLGHYDYVECKEERTLSSKASSRTWAKDKSLCRVSDVE